MVLVRPRLTDFYNLPIAQEDVDFAIPYLEEDIPLGVDPFLLWKSPALQDNSLHLALVNSFNHLGHLVSKAKEAEARDILIKASECDFTRLGFSQTGQGRRIGPTIANDILSLFSSIPQLKESGFIHFEEIQLLVDNLSKDRISDFACSFLLSFLIDFTIQECEGKQIPTEDVQLPFVYDLKTNRFVENEQTKLPVSPTTKQPIVFVPKRWLRSLPWINYDNYSRSFFKEEIGQDEGTFPDRIKVLTYNRNHYDMVRAYTTQREKTQEDCKNDPLFKPLPVVKVKQKLSRLIKLPSGIKDKADKKYEEIIAQLLSSMLYPHLDFADEQSRVDSGVHIRDLIFYNSRSVPFLQDVYNDYGSQQIVIEMKNVASIEREHVNQLNRYLANHLGRFGIIVTRHEPKRNIRKNTIDLWSGQRKCIIFLTDEDIEQMCDVFESRQRLPIEVLQKKFVEFARSCPS